MINGNEIFIFEFVSGGGFNKVKIPSHIFCEGYGMLRSIIADFKAENFEVRTLLDYRISSLSPFLDADVITEITENDDYMKIFKDNLEQCKYCFIIAPEFSDILFNLTKIAKDYNKIILSVNLEGIKLGTSKVLTHDFFKINRIPIPKTYKIPLKNSCMNAEFIYNKFNEINCPFVIKPIDGVGAESIFYFETKDQINAFFQDNSDKIEPNRYYILQEYIEGRDLSVSLVGYKKKNMDHFPNPLILSINSQEINIKNINQESEYFGGHTPANDHAIISKSITKYLKRLDFPLCGYFGIDFIRTTEKKNWFIEINPRLTTSYIGIRNCLNRNPVKLILNSRENTIDFNEFKIINCSIFSRLELKYNGNDSYYDIQKNIIPKLMRIIPELITPPISLKENDINNGNVISCFISTKTKKIEESYKRIKQINTVLQTHNFSDIFK